MQYTHSFNEYLSSTYYVLGPRVGKHWGEETQALASWEKERYESINYRSECKITSIINVKRQKHPVLSRGAE